MGKNMPRTLFRRHEQYQSRAVFSKRRRREMMAAIVVMGGDIAARCPRHKAAYSIGGMVRIQAMMALTSCSVILLK